MAKDLVRTRSQSFNCAAGGELVRIPIKELSSGVLRGGAGVVVVGGGMQGGVAGRGEEHQ